MDRNLLSLQGAEIVNQEGKPVILCGFGLGGWMNMESFVIGRTAAREFADCFRGMSEDEIEELMRSFQFGRCQKRQALAAILSEWARKP